MVSYRHDTCKNIYTSELWTLSCVIYAFTLLLIVFAPLPFKRVAGSLILYYFAWTKTYFTLALLELLVTNIISGLILQSQAMSHMLCIGYGRFPPQNLTDLWLTIFRWRLITMTIKTMTLMIMMILTIRMINDHDNEDNEYYDDGDNYNSDIYHDNAAWWLELRATQCSLVMLPTSYRY